MPAHTSVLISMKHQYLGVLLRPPGPDANPLQGYPPTVCRQYLVIQLAEERQSGVKFLCLRKQHDVQGLNPGPPDPEFEVLTIWPHTPPKV